MHNSSESDNNDMRVCAECNAPHFEDEPNLPGFFIAAIKWKFIVGLVLVLVTTTQYLRSRVVIGHGLVSLVYPNGHSASMAGSFFGDDTDFCDQVQELGTCAPDLPGVPPVRIGITVAESKVRRSARSSAGKFPPARLTLWVGLRFGRLTNID